MLHLLTKNKYVYQANFKTTTEIPHKLTAQNLEQAESNIPVISWDTITYTNKAPVQIITIRQQHMRPHHSQKTVMI